MNAPLNLATVDSKPKPSQAPEGLPTSDEVNTLRAKIAKRGANVGMHLVLRFLSLNFNYRPSLRRFLSSADGPLSVTVGFRTESGSVEQYLMVSDGRLRVSARRPSKVDTSLVFRDEQVMWEMLLSPPNESMLLLMRSKMRTEGNLNYLSLCSFLLSVVFHDGHNKALRKQKQAAAAECAAGPATQTQPKRKDERLRGSRSGATRYLDDPYLSQYRLADFPRLAKMLGKHFDVMAEICAERPALLTEWFRKNGFESDAQGKPWNPMLRQAHAFKYLMERREPRIGEDALLAGTTTAKEVGVVIYPDAHGVTIWGELFTTAERPLNPYRISPETLRVLHHDVFPYWVNRSFREWVRDRFDDPLCQQIDDRFAVYFLWKTAALSHTIADYPRILALGTKGLIAEIDEELGQTPADDTSKREALEAMRLSLEGITAYGRNLAKQARAQAASCSEATRRRELEEMAAACERSPEHPAATLQEAVQAIWTTWIGLHMENTNAGLSLGRLDQWLQPYFAADMAKLESSQEREAYTKKAVELIGDFYMRCTDHLPLVPDIGNYLFGGSSSDQAITLGGLTPEGEDAVNDMTYVFLKVTEMLKLRDPNVNARYSLTRNNDTYLQRLCEVNLITTATPSMHCDETILRSLEALNYPIEHARDWSATGCVEPTLSGKHMGHTNCMMFNTVAALEMALYDGLHPLMRWRVGPRTGAPEEGAFATFEDFFDAFKTQLSFLVDESISYNNMLGEAHAVIRPTPLLSAFLEGPLKKGIDVTRGGALYNSSGVACIGLADIVDSLMAVRTLVYDTKRVTFAELKAAMADNFEGHPKIAALIDSKVAKFGSGDADALAMANRITSLAHQLFSAKKNYRGGPYTTGFWSMSNHVAFGSLTGALPSGRRSGKAFTPGLTPSPAATPNLLDNLRDVALLDPANMDNNVAFNVKYVPSVQESHFEAIEHMASYAKAYFSMGGMQMQLNVVSSETLRDAMAHPENYKDLLVRISGYNAYFVTLNRDMQIELIERAEYGG